LEFQLHVVCIGPRMARPPHWSGCKPGWWNS